MQAKYKKGRSWFLCIVYRDFIVALIEMADAIWAPIKKISDLHPNLKILQLKVKKLLDYRKMTLGLSSVLSGRTFITVKGKDATRFLQALITNDIFALDERPLLYSAFLNAKVNFQCLLS